MQQKAESADKQLRVDEQSLHKAAGYGLGVESVTDAIGGKLTEHGGIFQTTHLDNNSDYETKQGDKLEIRSSQAAYDETTRFKDAYTNYGGNLVVDNFGNVFEKRSDGSEVIRTTEGKIYAKDSTNGAWHESHEQKDHIHSAKYLKELDDSYKGVFMPTHLPKGD
jgi:hypothetical protein